MLDESAAVPQTRLVVMLLAGAFKGNDCKDTKQKRTVKDQFGKIKAKCRTDKNKLYRLAVDTKQIKI